MQHLSVFVQEDAVSCLVLGTETGRIIILDQTASQVIKEWPAGGVPAFLVASGTSMYCSLQPCKVVNMTRQPDDLPVPRGTNPACGQLNQSLICSLSSCKHDMASVSL